MRFEFDVLMWVGVAGGALGGGDFRGCWYLETSKETSYREGRSWPGGCLRYIGLTTANEGCTVHRCTEGGEHTDQSKK